MGKETDGIFLKGNKNRFTDNDSDSTDGIFLQYNNRIYACEDKYCSVSCFICVGKDKCANYRMKGCGF